MSVVTIPAGMVPWPGGDNVPEDWDGGPVLLIDGFTSFNHTHPIFWQQLGHSVVAYTPRTPVQPEAQWAEVSLAVAWQRVSDALDGIPGGMNADLEDAAAAMWSAMIAARPDAPPHIDSGAAVREADLVDRSALRSIMDDLIAAAGREWGSGSVEHNLVRDVGDAVSRVPAAIRQIALPVEGAGSCHLGAGKCRRHSLGHPEQWKPEPGSAAYVALHAEPATEKKG